MSQWLYCFFSSSTYILVLADFQALWFVPLSFGTIGRAHANWCKLLTSKLVFNLWCWCLFFSPKSTDIVGQERKISYWYPCQTWFDGGSMSLLRTQQKGTCFWICPQSGFPVPSSLPSESKWQLFVYLHFTWFAPLACLHKRLRSLRKHLRICSIDWSAVSNAMRTKLTKSIYRKYHPYLLLSKYSCWTSLLKNCSSQKHYG